MVRFEQVRKISSGDNYDKSRSDQKCYNVTFSHEWCNVKLIIIITNNQ